MNSRKKILIINWQDVENPYAGGAEVHLFETFKRLTDKYEIHLLCCKFKGCFSEENIDGIYIHRVGDRNTFNFYVPKAYAELQKKYHFDIVIEDINKIPFFGRFFIHKKRMAIVHHLFGNTIFYEAGHISGIYVYFTERLIPKFYKDIPVVSVSKDTTIELNNMGIPEKNLYIIYNGVDLKKYHPAKKTEYPLVVLLGRLKKYKEIDIFLESLSLLKDIHHKFQVKIVGGGDDIIRLKKIANKLKLNPILEFTGVVSEDEKAKILRESWVSVNTSAKEGWGLTSMEAQASGTLSIVPDSPGLRETVIHEKTGFIYSYGDIKELSDRIKYVIENGQMMEVMGKKAREWAEKFTWEKTAEAIDKVIKVASI